MATWWNAIDLAHSSYDELKHRRVIAQGWSDLGNISALVRFLPDGFTAFAQVVQLLGDRSYREMPWWNNIDRNESRTPTVMWNLLSLREGDLVVGLEGTNVRGICMLTSDAVRSYQHQPAWEYAQTVGFPIDWHDWDSSIFGPAPTPPAHGVLGIKHLQNEGRLVESAWERISSSLS